MAKNKKYTSTESKILVLITNYCANECPSSDNCPEEECVLYNIEQTITKEKTKDKEK